MTAALSAGVVRIVAQRHGERIVGARVRSERPRGLGRALAQHAPRDIPALAQRLFALCGMSHAVAATQALRAAGAPCDRAGSATTWRTLAAERLAEHLRATVMGWRGVVPPSAEELIAVREALAEAGAARVSARLPAALATLGIAPESRRAGSWAARLIAAAAEIDAPAVDPADALRSQDDFAVARALDRGGDDFAAQPALPDRVAETGPAARAASVGRPSAGGAARLSARLAEIVEAAAIMSEPAQAETVWTDAAALDDGVAFAAVETPRGRLYHLVRLQSRERVARYDILAPTEWNFAPQGPFARALDGLRIDARGGVARIERLASLYDPCVDCAVTLEEQAHAEPADA